MRQEHRAGEKMFVDYAGPTIPRSTLVTSQLPIDHWHDMTDAILDRLVHNAHKIKMRGESMRKRKAGTKESLTETDQ